MKRTLLTLLTVLAATPAVAQISNADDLIKGGADDGNKLVAAYTKPFVAGMSAALASGWFNTAATHKPGRVAFTIFAAGALAPSEDQSFNPQALGLRNISVAGNSTPTIMGSNTAGPPVTITNPTMTGPRTITGGTFNMPAGVGFPIAPGIGLQLGVGVYKNTDLLIRYLPELSLGDNYVNIGYWGLGLKHDWKQWFPGLNKLPFHSALVFGYSRITGDLKLELTRPGVAVDSDPSRDISNQRAEYESSSYMVGVIGSKQFSVFTLYGGLMYMWSTNSLRLTGNYPVASWNAAGTQESIAYLVDPVTINADNPNSIGANLGFRLKFGAFTWNLDYTLANYMMFNMGLGFSIGENDSMDSE